jgi:lysozyme family protein
MKVALGQLRPEYIELFERCKIRPEYQHAVDGFLERLALGKPDYQKLEIPTGVPWYVVGLIHGLECDFNFRQHLHNGDSLQHRTVNEPTGRPVKGDPPFDWDYSAIDALSYDKFIGWTDWSAAGICYKLEGYNGWGYRARHVNSPYLWSCSNNYERGKFVSDGHWDPDAVSKQVGAIVALKQMVVNHDVNLKAAA